MAALKGQEIFAVGKWNGTQFTERHLDDIIANFNELAEVNKVPLKFGHNDEQNITDGQPAIGWVSAVYRQGKKLLADFADVPEVVFNAIKKRLYRSVSVELLRNVEYKGKQYRDILDAVALLGADKPAVNTLEDLTALMSRANFSGGRRCVFSTVSGNYIANSNSQREIDMTPDEMKKAIAEAVTPLREEIDALKSANDTLRGENDKFKRKEKERDEQDRRNAIDAARKKIKATFERAVQERAITPAQRETLSELLNVNDDDAVMKLDFATVEKLIKSSGAPQTGQHSRSDAEDEDADLTAGEKLVRMAHEHRVKTGEKSFSVAFSRVAQANPELHREYLLSNGNKRDDREVA